MTPVGPSLPLPPDVPWRTMVELLTAVGDRGDAPALTATSATGEVVCCGGRRLLDLVARTAGLLAAHGAGPGQTVVVHLDNRCGLEALVVHWAAQWMGAVPVPVGTRLTPPEIGYVLDHSGAVLVCSALDGLAPAAAAGAGEPGPALLDLGPGLLGLTHGRPEASPAAVTEHDIADLLYTSGTTARPKGVELTHGNNVATGLQLAAAVELTGDDVYQSAIPYFTSTGAHANPLQCLVAGAHFVLEPAFDQHRTFPRAAAEGTTTYLGAPSMLRLIVRDADLARRPPSLRHLVFGGSVTTATALEELAAALPGCALTNLYGQTEAGPGGTVCKPADILRKAGSIGDRGMGPHVTVAVLGDDGQPVAAGGELGEIVLRSPAVMASYRHDPDATAAAFAGGWLHTGDLAYVDDEGFLFYADRRKDLIIRGGMNISSAEVESVLLAHPLVDDVAVIGVAHDVLGEDVVAVVVSEGGVDPAELAAQARRSLADYKVPRRVVFVEELPRNAMGKVLKQELRRQVPS